MVKKFDQLKKGNKVNYWRQKWIFGEEQIELLGRKRLKL